MASNFERRFGDCDRIAREYVAGNLGPDGWSRCARANYVGCTDCRFEDKDCNCLDRYDVSVEWLHEEEQDGN